VVSLVKPDALLLACAVTFVGSRGASAGLADDDAFVCTPPGFDRPGAARTTVMEAVKAVWIRIVRDRSTSVLCPGSSSPMSD
jgi:hypothetical protein